MKFATIYGACLALILGSMAAVTYVCASSVESRSCREGQLRIDFDSDGELDCVVTERVGSETVLKVRISNLGAWIVLNSYVHSDEKIEIQHLSKYRNSKFTAPRVGSAIRLMFPEKSSVLYYWDKGKSKFVEFWESD